MAQCFAPNLDAQATLHKIRDILQDIPRMWMSRGEQPEDHLYGTVTGECNYLFSLKAEGGSFFQTGVLVALAESQSGSVPVPLKCRWKRRVGDLFVEIPGVTSNMYQISADDVGTRIAVEAQPADADDGFYGVVEGEIGPFELDPLTRRNLDNALGLGDSRFEVAQLRVLGDNSPGNRQDMLIHVGEDGVRLTPKHGGAERSRGEVFAEYSADYPKVIIHPLDTAKFQLVMSETNTFHLIASTRAVRDLIALTVRCFHAKRYVTTADVLEALLPIQQPLLEAGPSHHAANRLEACIRLERLLKELNRAMQQKELSEKVVRNAKYEKKQLQAQLMESIQGCTDVIIGLQDQFAAGTPSSAPVVPVEELQRQLRACTTQNQELQQEMDTMKECLQQFQSARQAQEEAKPVLEELYEERELLRGRLSDLGKSGPTVQQQDRADQNHAHELKRLRNDVEQLHTLKGELRQQLQDKDREKQELQDNFLYVKGQLDKWQLKLAEEIEGDGSTKELDRHHQMLAKAREERTRLSTRLESALREVEKEKVYHEQQLDRVMQANSRLLEERDRTGLEVQRLSQMYADSVTQMQSDQSNAGQADELGPDMGEVVDADAVAASAQPDPEEIVRIQAQIKQANEALLAKERENESLRSRIRRLAVAPSS